MKNQRGIAHLLLLLAILVAIGVGTYFLFKGNLNNFSKISLNKSAAEPKVTLKTSYKNPFKKETQYVNPFDEFKSPFLNFERK